MPFLDSDELPHLLFAAFAEVPGPTAIGARLVQLIGAFSDEFDVDGMTLKGRELAHIQRLGTARMLRVPVEEKGFHERLGAYTRALGRQLNGDVYQLVYCADVFSAQIAAAYRESAGFSLILEVNDLPSESFDGRYPVDDPQAPGKPAPDLGKLRGRWREIEKQALRAADVVVVPSRHAARVLSERVDARRLLIMPRAVDRTVFSPPSVEVAVDRRRTVLLVGARDEAGEREDVVSLLHHLVRLLPPEVALVLAAQGQPDSEELERALEGTGLDGRVRRLDLDGPVRLANALIDADVVVIPARGLAGSTPLGIPHRVLEAFACRRAVVLAGSAAPLRGMLDGDGHLVIVDPLDPELVADAVVDLLGDDERRARLAGAGFRYAGDQADLEASIQDFAHLISDRLGVHMHPRSPEHTERAPSADGPPSELDLPMVSDVELLHTLMPDGAEVPRPVSMERFSAERALEADDALATSSTAVHARARRSGSDPWGDDTQVESSSPDAPPPPRPEPTPSASSPSSELTSGLLSTESGLLAGDGLQDLVDPVRGEGHFSLEAQPTSTYQPVWTHEQRSADRTQAGDAEAARLVDEERARAIAPRGRGVPQETAVAPREEVDTESARYESLAPRFTDPRLMDPRFTDPALRAPPGTQSGLSPSAIESLVEVAAHDESDPWAPDTVFDASPLFSSAEQTPTRLPPSLDTPLPSVSLPPTAPTESGIDPQNDTQRNPRAPPRTETSSRGPKRGDQPKSLLVDVEREPHSETDRSREPHR